MSWQFCVKIFSQDGVTITRDTAKYGYDVTFLVQEVNAGPHESKIHDLTFELDA